MVDVEGVLLYAADSVGKRCFDTHMKRHGETSVRDADGNLSSKCNCLERADLLKKLAAPLSRIEKGEIKEGAMEISEILSV